MDELLKGLNEDQRKAVIFNDGPALVIAGAGSGKTRVLTYKIAYLLSKGLPPQSILALTFTNKAAKEMKERISKMVGSQAYRLWMGTFHSIFSRILRAEADRLGYPSDFTIYDSADSKNLLKSIIKEMALDDKTYRPGMVQARISNAKNALVTHAAYARSKELMEHDMACKVPMIREIYTRYQTRCYTAKAMDFDDLLMQTNILFRDFPEVLEKYRDFFKYILVDEYQDTNFSQHLIVQKLSEHHKRICVVGDDAQSIYSFRGANIDNILKFRTTYEGCKTFKLERNYRSTRNIVNAANSLIHKNTEQIKKTIYSEKEDGSKIKLVQLYSDYEEAHNVAAKIATSVVGNNEYEFSDFAILYRTNAQSRVLEEALRKSNLPYRIYGGLSFYQRKEIKDIISYFRLIVNHADEEAFKRIINYPARGIGDTTLNKVKAYAAANNLSLWETLSAVGNLTVNSGTANKLIAFRELILRFCEYSKNNPLEDVVDFVMKESGMVALLAQDSSVEGISKYENAKELAKGIVEFCEIKREEGVENITMADFLSEVALLTDQDDKSKENTNRITLMTVHSAKGLEFKNVFIVGLEEDLFPSQMSRDNLRAIEEERRLLYVAITRAEENCVLSCAKSRFRNGQSTICSPSRFLKDIDPNLIDFLVETKAEWVYHKPVGKPILSTENLTKLSKALVSAPSEATSLEGLDVGARVKHIRFGEGYIKGFEGEGGNTKAIVEFDNSGTKQLLLKFAKLTVI